MGSNEGYRKFMQQTQLQSSSMAAIMKSFGMKADLKFKSYPDRNHPFRLLKFATIVTVIFR